jgi:hypothetical protein
MLSGTVRPGGPSVRVNGHKNGPFRTLPDLSRLLAETLSAQALTNRRAGDLVNEAAIVATAGHRPERIERAVGDGAGGDLVAP